MQRWSLGFSLCKGLLCMSLSRWGTQEAQLPGGSRGDVWSLWSVSAHSALRDSSGPAFSMGLCSQGAAQVRFAACR